MRRLLLLVVVFATACSTSGGSSITATVVSTTSTTAPPSTTAPAATTVPAAVVDTGLQAELDSWAATYDPIGIAAAVRFPDGRIWTGASGLADRGAGTPVLPSDRFQIASVTKTFIAVLTMRLVEDGFVELDAPIEPLLPGFPRAEAITVRHLLSHRAGVFDPVVSLVGDPDQPGDPNLVFTPADLLGVAAAGSPVFEPGSRFEYSNGNYVVLGAVLEAATGEEVTTLLQRHLFQPLALDQTMLLGASLSEVTVVNAYTDLDHDGEEDAMGTVPLSGFVTVGWTAGAMVSTASDLVTFLDAVFAGAVISDESLEAMLDISGGGSYGLGMDTVGGRWGHTGGTIGYRSAVYHDRRTGITAAVLINRSGVFAPRGGTMANQILSRAALLTSG